MQKEQENLLAGLIGIRAMLCGLEGDGENALVLSKQVLALVPADNLLLRSQTLLGQTMASFTSSVNDAQAGLQIGLQGISLAQDAGVPSLTVALKGMTALWMVTAGQLHDAWRLTQQAILLGKQPGEPVLSIVGLSSCIQAEILREWNQLDEALSLAEEALALCNQIPSMNSLSYLLLGYAVQLRVHLSLGNLERAYSLFQQLEAVGIRLNQLYCTHTYSYFTIIDQVRLWLAYGELDRATRWVEDLDKQERHSNPFVCEREEVGCVRVLLAKQQADSALERLEPVLQRAITGQRWGHVIEMRLLQALAYQMLKREMLALSVLTEAVRLGESEGYIRSFVDEGTKLEALLYQLRKRNRKHGPTPYLDTLLAVFQQKIKAHAQTEAPAQLPEPLSEREREVLQLLAQGASNLEIAQELVITVDTVKRHTSHIFSKLGVHNRMQAVLQARELGLLC